MRNKGKGKGVAGPVVESPGKNGFSLIPGEKLIELYTNLLRLKVFEQRLAGLFKPQGSLLSPTTIGGFEAAMVGVAIDLVSEDTITFSDDEYLTGLIKGMPLGTVLHSLTANGRPSRVNAPPDRSNSEKRNSISQTALNAAIGAALANKTRKNRKIAVVFSRDGALESFCETIGIASVHELPMIFVCQDYPIGGAGGRSPHEAVDKRTGETESPWFPSITVDSSDVVAVYRVGYEAIARARQGRGPTLINCQRFPLDGRKNSIHNMESYLRGKGLFRPPLKKQIMAGLTNDLDAAVDRLKRGATRSTR